MTRNNSEAIISVDGRTRRDFAQGVAITSSNHPEADTHLQVCRYGIGQNALFAMQTTMVDGGAFRVAILGRPVRFVRTLSLRRASERTIILLPTRGEPDPRPPLGTGYRRIRPVEPNKPIVPEVAPGALRLPVQPA